MALGHFFKLSITENKENNYTKNAQPTKKDFRILWMENVDLTNALSKKLYKKSSVPDRQSRNTTV
jgi:hypothetical protein